jgi:LAO/AO transport system kinase
MRISALHGQGIDEFWHQVSSFQTIQSGNGRLAARRQQQSLAWMWERIESGLKQQFRDVPQVRELLPSLTQQVALGHLPASTAARQLLALARGH